jgi:hypothetical protein
MAFTATNNLQIDPNTLLRDQEHAAKLFVPDQFRLAPKHKFLFHVAFGINTGALSNVNIVQRYGQEINMLVKSVDLPSYTISTEMLNQYNRKKVVQLTHKPQEIAITFHDDNMGLINQVWQSYYSYYFADSTSAKNSAAYAKNATKSSDYIPTNYGLDNGSVAPFFNYIKIYQMARHEYVMYNLVNPVIVNWNHNKLDYAQSGVHDFTMKLAYEAVSYDVGEVTAGDPEGFGLSHYDNTPSPLSGINPDPSVINPSFVASLDIETIAPSILNTVINQVNAAQNTQQPIVANGQTGVIAVSTLQNIGGLAGVAFPTSPAVSNNTVATLTNLTGL